VNTDLNLASKIKTLRLASDLTQEELANRSQLTKGFISQLENGQTSISVDSLSDILDALGISLSEFFSDTRAASVVYGPSDRVNIEDKGVNKFELLVPGSTNNEMDPALIKLKKGEALDIHEPFAGELFGFVLKGRVTLEMSSIVHQIPANHCFCFRADQPHRLLNRSNAAASLLLVTSPPQM